MNPAPRMTRRRESLQIRSLIIAILCKSPDEVNCRDIAFVEKGIAFVASLERDGSACVVQETAAGP